MTKRQRRRRRKKPKITSVEPDLLVFVSSVIRGMDKEREIVERSIRSIPVARPWRFETTPASSQEVEASYLSKVRECDIFILLIGDSDSEAVRREYETALEASKPVLAFVAEVDRPPELQAFVASIRSKYGVYSEPDELYDAVKAAVLDEVIRRFRSAIRPEDTSKVIETVTPEVQTFDVREILNGVIFGIEDQALKSIFEVFGGKELTGSLADPSLPFEDIYFAHPDEAKDVIDALNKVVSKAKKSRGNRQKAFERALTKEALARASHYAVEQAGLRPTTPSSPIPGLKYMILRIHSNFATMIRLLRTREVFECPLEIERDAEEILFEDPTILQAAATVFQEAQQDSEDDPEEFFRLLIAGALRLQVLGPDGLSDDD